MKKSIHTAEYAAMCEALRAVRGEAGLSQRALALRLKVTPSWVAKVETGERRVDLIEFVRFLDACGGDAVETLSRLLGPKPALRERRLKPPAKRGRMT